SSVDNVDIRYADHFTKGDLDLVYGVTMHNAPTVQDVWNTIPAWSYPYQGPKVATNGMGPASTFIESGARVVGIGAYGYLNNSYYGEISLYRTADQMFSILRAGNTVNPGDAVALSGLNPYWRFAYSKSWGDHSATLGYFGMRANQFPDSTNPVGATDHFLDQGVDAQYQYITDEHTVSTQLSYIWEKATWNASYAGGGFDNPSSRTQSFKAKASYYYQRKYGVTLGYFATTGDADCARYCLKDEEGAPLLGSDGQPLGAKPDTRGTMFEVSYTPFQNLRLAAQYTAFNKFNGTGSNYDGNGRKASDNNTMYVYAWFAY
ncbi:MAG: cytochrome C, partial [Burkholderiales bacterium]|nr:cytochrome C [Burkholderiales bacterium]